MRADPRVPSGVAVLGTHGRKLRALERATDGRWLYVLPVAPATEPGDYIDGDPLYVDFEAAWANIVGHLPTAFQVVRGRFYLRGSFTGDEETPDSLVFTVPAGLLDSEDDPYPVLCAVGSDGTGIGVVWVDPASGEVTWKGEITGSDPTFGVIEALGFLHWGSNTDADVDGLTLETASDVQVLTDGQVYLATGGGSGPYLLLDPSGGVAFLYSSDSVTVQSVGAIEIAAGSTLAINAISNIEVRLNGAGTTFTLKDSSGNPMLRMTEGSPNLHIKTGGSVIADL